MSGGRRFAGQTRERLVRWMEGGDFGWQTRREAVRCLQWDLGRGRHGEGLIGVCGGFRGEADTGRGGLVSAEGFGATQTRGGAVWCLWRSVVLGNA